MVEHHLLTGLQIRGNGPERDGQLTERGVARHGSGPVLQQGLQAIALDEPRRQPEAVAAEAGREAARIELLVFALRLGQVGAFGHVERDIGQVDLGEARFHLLRSHPARVQATHHRTHAGGGDTVDRDAVFFEYLQHTQVGVAACAAAG